MTRAVTTQFAAATSPSLPALDADLLGVANLAVVACTATGTNAVVLTPVAATVTVSAYSDKELYSFNAPATSTGVMTVQVSSGAALKLFRSGGATQATTNDVISAQFYLIAYQASLDTGTGGFVIVSAISNSGRTVQVVNFETGAIGTPGTTVIPNDDTIPQNTEGDQYMSLAITPTNASSTLLIDIVLMLSNSAANNNIIAALFQDNTASALAAMMAFQATATGPLVISFRHKMVAGTTISTTFKVRAGGALAGTTTLNGSGGGRLYGGVAASSITITEILP